MGQSDGKQYVDVGRNLVYKTERIKGEEWVEWVSRAVKHADHSSF